MGRAYRCHECSILNNEAMTDHPIIRHSRVGPSDPLACICGRQYAWTLVLALISVGVWLYPHLFFTASHRNNQRRSHGSFRGDACKRNRGYY